MSPSEYYKFAIYFAGASLVISILTFIKSLFDAKKNKKSSNEAKAKAQEALDVQHGSLEMQIRTSITAARSEISKLAPLIGPLQAKRDSSLQPNSSDEFTLIEMKTLETYHKTFETAIEDLLNTYNEACQKYMDGKVDKIRFRKNYFHEIRNVVTNAEFEDRFNPITSMFQATIAVYNEWHNVQA